MRRKREKDAFLGTCRKWTIRQVNYPVSKRRKFRLNWRKFCLALRICDPWEAKTFRDFAENVPDEHCAHCLPDCEGIVYKASVSALPFRRCNSKNLGVSKLCTLSNKNAFDIIKFGRQVRLEHEDDVRICFSISTEPLKLGNLFPSVARLRKGNPGQLEKICT